MSLQEKVSQNILEEVYQKPESRFTSRFRIFLNYRAILATRFRRMVLDQERRTRLTKTELEEAAAHGMSLYMAHGSLLKKLCLEKRIVPDADHQNLIIVNHNTPNLSNFHVPRFVPGCEDLERYQNIPVGIVEGGDY